MEHEATINARLPQTLKSAGTRVLDENGASPTQIIRSLYRYMEREGRIPACLDDASESAQDRYENRRTLARAVAGTIHLTEDLDIKEERTYRIQEHYGELL